MQIGDGVEEAECEVASDGLGSPWRCELDTDSEGLVVWFVTVSVDGRFRAGEGLRGGTSGCCLPVSE